MVSSTFHGWTEHWRETALADSQIISFSLIRRKNLSLFHFEYTRLEEIYDQSTHNGWNLTQQRTNEQKKSKVKKNINSIYFSLSTQFHQKGWQS